MKGDKYKGKRYIGLARCSTRGQADTSVEDQLTILRVFAEQHGMQHVDDVILDGVTGSIPGARHDIGQLIERKATRDDFDVLLVQDSTRLTRSGAGHGHKIEYDLGVAGIETVFAAEDIPDGDFSEVLRSLKYESGLQHAKSISYSSVRGSMSALLDGRSAHCRRPPYGIDKLYVGPDGQPHHLIRNLVDGTQLMLAHDTGDVKMKFGRNEETGAPAHYRKQKDECIVLVPGSEDTVAVVRQIYNRHHVDNWGGPRIATELNDQGIPAPEGGQWHVCSVRNILKNPIYTGLGIANRYSSAVYHRRSKDGPEKRKIDRKVLAERARPPLEVRPQEDWIQRECTELVSLLDADIKALASKHQASYLERQADGYVPQPDRDRHTDSDFILKGILTCRQGGYVMTGRRSGRKKPRTRYYAVTKALSTPSSDKTLRKLVRAEPLEQAVLGLIQLIISRKEDFQRDVDSIVKRQLSHRKDDRNDVQEWIRQRDGAAQKLNFIIEELDDVGRDVARKKVETLQAQIRSLDERIRQASAPMIPDSSDAATVVKTVLDRLANIPESLHNLPKPALRRLIASFVSRAVVDLETKEVELELRLPEWAFQGNDAMCLDDKFACKYDIEAHRFSGPILLKPRLLWVQRQLMFVATDFATAA